MEAVNLCKGLLGDMLAQASEVKRTNVIEPPILKADIEEGFRRLQELPNFVERRDAKKLTRYAVIEIAVREVFIDLLVRIPTTCEQRPILTGTRPPIQ